MSVDQQVIFDHASGLFTEEFLLAGLPTRGATARRAMKQLGLVFISLRAVDDGPGAEPSSVGPIIRNTLRDSDTGVLLDDGRYALLLEFTPVEGCVIIANRLADRFADSLPGVAVNIGIGSYPVHAINAVELLEAADRAVLDAVQAGPGTVVVAPLAD